MRTKTLLTAAALAAGALTAMAQSNVYSLNVVGYYNVTAPAGGLVLTANQLDTGTNGLNQVLPGAQLGDQVLTFKNGDYNIDVFDGTQWLDNNTANPTTTVVPPGVGFFYQNVQSGSETLTFVGQVEQGSLVKTYPTGFTLSSTKVPAALSLNSNGFPQVLGMQCLLFNGDYVIYVNDGGPPGGSGWLDNNTALPVNLSPGVGVGYYIQNSDPTTYTWTLNFTVQ
jgi:hypothetical protein